MTISVGRFKNAAIDDRTRTTSTQTPSLIIPHTRRPRHRHARSSPSISALPSSRTPLKSPVSLSAVQLCPAGAAAYEAPCIHDVGPTAAGALLHRRTQRLSLGSHTALRALLAPIPPVRAATPRCPPPQLRLYIRLPPDSVVLARWALEDPASHDLYAATARAALCAYGMLAHRAASRHQPPSAAARAALRRLPRLPIRTHTAHAQHADYHELKPLAIRGHILRASAVNTANISAFLDSLAALLLSPPSPATPSTRRKVSTSTRCCARLRFAPSSAYLSADFGRIIRTTSTTMTTSVDRPKDAAIDDRTRTTAAQDPGVGALGFPHTRRPRHAPTSLFALSSSRTHPKPPAPFSKNPEAPRPSAVPRQRGRPRCVLHPRCWYQTPHAQRAPASTDTAPLSSHTALRALLAPIPPTRAAAPRRRPTQLRRYIPLSEDTVISTQRRCAMRSACPSSRARSPPSTPPSPSSPADLADFPKPYPRALNPPARAATPRRPPTHFRCCIPFPADSVILARWALGHRMPSPRDLHSVRLNTRHAGPSTPYEPSPPSTPSSISSPTDLPNSSQPRRQSLRPALHAHYTVRAICGHILRVRVENWERRALALRYRRASRLAGCALLLLLLLLPSVMPPARLKESISTCFSVAAESAYRSVETDVGHPVPAEAQPTA
ncbi:hypothetical protein HYPSUDRAFT_218813 [Hypholoma sublateritium FD-334 SS-4]|uniref:Uncharacterized protein n=1 Tax=Hypholoma sublateritium (strain FD-334 SS-4) TaxID=945553 RepID=A0A0D2PAX7_HYPSF|nr:hypothetical protein HYPSUDRAFT_218813 [Hypholoma sublateritium FD-334 SS-4]